MQVNDFVLYIIAFIISTSKRQTNCPAVSVVCPSVLLVKEIVYDFLFDLFLAVLNYSPYHFHLKNHDPELKNELLKS